MTSALFCDQCGAALPAQATSCPACRYYFGMPSAPSSLPVQTTQTSLPHDIAAITGTFVGELRPGTLFARRYRILEQVGEGGFGNIYKAEDLDAYRRLVAIKQINLRLLSPQRMIEATDSFNREVDYLSRLKHGHIPRIYDHFTDPDHWYIIMEYIKGETLENKLKKARRGRFSTQQVFDIGIALCDELGYLHRQSPPIIFRDVKPGNIMQTGTGRIYLIDFGIARHYAPGQSRDTSPLGSPGYAAPEQYGKAQTTPQTDIYGLGATLQTLLTGKEPLEILLEGASHHRTVPKNLQLLLTSMLERDPAKRPQSMDEVKQSLQSLKEHSAREQTKRTCTFIRNSAIEMMWIMAALLFISFLFLASGFFSSPFWIPGLLMILLVAVARSVHYIHQDMQEATTKLNVQETFATVLKRLKGSILYSLIPAILFSCLYSLQGSVSVSDTTLSDYLFYLFYGGVVLAWIIYSIFILKEEIKWLLHLMLWRRNDASKQQQIPPLQQRQWHR
ncbi:MAG: serine/threonine protein kinase [Ktedonobacteraceae bacterium]